MEIISFDVLDKHLEEGRKGNANQCPVALALLDMGLQKVGVFNHSLNFCTAASWRAPILPIDLEEFISSFDKHGYKYVQPRSFTIDVYERKGAS